MAPKRMAVVDVDGKVENVILLEDGANWQVPEGRTLVEDKTGKAEPGGSYVAKKFNRPIIETRERAFEELPLEERVRVLKAQLDGKA